MIQQKQYLFVLKSFCMLSIPYSCLDFFFNHFELSINIFSFRKIYHFPLRVMNVYHVLEKVTYESRYLFVYLFPHIKCIISEENYTCWVKSAFTVNVSRDNWLWLLLTTGSRADRLNTGMADDCFALCVCF